jgi:Ca2+-binding RTX toxin-like protein
MLVGATWAESFNGLAGDDTIVPGTGNDVNLGGPGTDRLIAESTNGRRFTFDLTAKTLVGQGTDSFKGFEMLISTSVGADTFVGDPARSLLLVSGGGGVNLLDLSSASGGVQVRTVPASDPGLVEVGWIVADGVLVIGTPFADIINGMPGAFSNEHDQFRGMGGDDRLAGAGGADDLLGGAGDDRLLGGVGTDTCVGGPGDDVLKGCEN